jgi:hypothetical protein
MPKEDHLLRQGAPREACPCPYDSGFVARSSSWTIPPPIPSHHEGSVPFTVCCLLDPSSPGWTDRQVVRREARGFSRPAAARAHPLAADQTLQRHKPTHAHRFAVERASPTVRACSLLGCQSLDLTASHAAATKAHVLCVGGGWCCAVST